MKNANLLTLSTSLLAVCLLAFAGCSRPAETEIAEPAAAEPADDIEIVEVDDDRSEADKMWDELEVLTMPPPFHVIERLTPEEMVEFRLQQGELSAEAADLAKEFYTRFPEDPRADEVRRKEFRLVRFAVDLGIEDRKAQLDEMEQARLNDLTLSEDERFDLRMQILHRETMARQEEGMSALLAEFEKGVEELKELFPERPEVFQMMLKLAANSEPEKARVIGREILDSSASDALKEDASGLLERLDLVGKPLDLRFTALDGREVDLANLQGKVVLVDFWASWSGPSVQERSLLRETYKQHKERGLDIVSIALDRDEERLKQTLEREQIDWPQFFDGETWDNRIAKQFGISTLPSYWLVDRQGRLRELNAREHLTEKLERLLSE